MDAETIRRERDELAGRYGDWTAHNIRLGDGLYTISEKPAGDEPKLRRVTQIVLDLFGGDVTGLRILDLACLEGMYSLELASRGAEVVAIEGREANLEKARFAARVHNIDRIEFEYGDVRDLSRARHGEFDVVLCLGILYHLASDDVFKFVERLGEVCKRALIVDTAISLSGPETREYEGHSYSGEILVEHDPGSSPEKRLRALWSSLDNPTSFVFTRPSLIRLLSRSGFTSVFECRAPAEPDKPTHRATLVALRGAAVTHLIGPDSPSLPDDVPERPPLGAWLPQSRWWRVGRLVVPRPLRAGIRRRLGAETRHHRG